MEITCRVYRPGKPRESPLYRLVEQHLEELLRVWPTRFVRQHGPLWPVVERTLREFMKCGLVEHGFARLWCGECCRSVLVAFSCRGRSFCPSCEKKKQLLWAEWLRENQLSIRRILDHLGLREPEQSKPPPPREILRVAEHGEGWGVSWD